MKRTLLEVTPAGASGWKVTRSGRKVSGASRKADAQRAAVQLAHVLANAGRLVSLKIKGRDGRIQEERTYPRSSDPRRTRG